MPVDALGADEDSALDMDDGGEMKSGQGLTSTAEKDHVLNDFDMLLARTDKIKVVKRKNADESYKALVSGVKPKETTYYTIEDCSLGHINGKYLDCGTACNVPKYRNTRGWAVFRCSLMEIPDLGIFADSCYEGMCISLILSLTHSVSLCLRAFCPSH